jgi:hypothetical protein
MSVAGAGGCIGSAVGLIERMQDSISLLCPHCGESFGLSLDVSEGSAEFTVDCEVCCRPMLVSVRINDGEIEGVDVVEE